MKSKHYAHGCMPQGQMNRTEALYEQRLQILQQTGTIQWFAFEAIKLKLADKTYYTPDFLVLNSDGMLECHEVKGFWRDDARVKIKVAAQKFPFRFLAVTMQSKKAGGDWDVEYF